MSLITLAVTFAIGKWNIYQRPFSVADETFEVSKSIVMLKLVQNIFSAADTDMEVVRSSRLLRSLDISIAVVTIMLVVMAVKLFF